MSQKAAVSDADAAAALRTVERTRHRLIEMRLLIMKKHVAFYDAI
jgi:hypothetical protein